MNTKNDRERARGGGGIVRGGRGAIWVSKFNSAHEKAKESEEKRTRERKSEDKVRGKCAEAQKALAICSRRPALRSGGLIVRTIVRNVRAPI